MRTFILLILFGFSLFLSSCHNKEKTNPNFPNIIFILADDMGYGDVSSLNPKSKISTPNLDRIAKEGMYFSDAHSGSAVCTPTRYGILTGRYAFRTRLKSGVLVGYDSSLIAPDRFTVGHLLKEANYQTACIGKWHLGLNWAKKDLTKPLFEGSQWDNPNTENVDYMATIGGSPIDRGFDYGYIIPSSLDIAPYCYIENRNLTKPITGIIEGQFGERGIFWRTADLQEGFKLEETLGHLTQKSVEFIENTSTEKPFFLYFPLTAPHTPWLPVDSVKGKSEAGTYGDFVVEVDNSVGKILEVLDRKNITENTLLIFTSDNGSHWMKSDIDSFSHHANYIFSGMKSDVWEGGHRVPFLARWPEKIKANSHSEEVICLTDFMATCAAITNQNPIEKMGKDSYNILPALLGEKLEAPIRDHTIHHSISGKFAIRKGKWKYISTKGSGGWTQKGKPEDLPGQLYDLENDPSEKINLYEENPQIVRELSNILRQYENLN